MYLLSLFGNHRVYSTQKLAAQNAAQWLRKFVIDNHWLWEQGITAEYRKRFDQSFQREDYLACVFIWNEYAIDKVGSNHPIYKASIIADITQIQLDERLT